MTKNKILLIDFDNEFLKFLSRALSQEGYEIQTATDGLAGFEKFSEFQPDLVIMEAMLPKFHGFELCSRITSHPTKKAPVIIVTGIYKDSVYKTEALKSLGASAFLEKPLNLETLLTRVYELIGKPEVKKHQVKTEEDKDLDELLKQALASAYTPAQSSPAGKPVEKTPRREEIRKTPPTPQDDEIDLILKSKLKGLISTSEEKAAPATVHHAPATAPPKKAEAPRPEPATQTKKPEPAVSQASAGSQTVKRPVEKEAKTTGLSQTIRPEPRAPQKSDQPRTNPPAAASFEETSRPAPAAVNPFKAYTESNGKKSTRKSPAKYIGLAASALAVIGLVAFLTLNKKKTPEFSGQPANQTAALQTAGADQNQSLPVQDNLSKEEDINKEIEKQMAEYRSQQARADKNAPSAANQNLKGSPAGRTSNKPVAIPAAPIIPEETPKIEVNMESRQQTTVPAQSNPAPGTSVQPEETKVNSEEPPVTASQDNQAKTEDQPVSLASQRAKPGEVFPLSAVDVEPKVVKSIDPIYPEVDRRAGVRGNIIVNALISENGDVLEAVVIRGIGGSVTLEKEAVSAVKKWKFLPAEKDGVKVKVWKPITIGFGLNK